MAAIVRFVDRLSSRRAILVLLVVYAAVFGSILVTLAQLTQISGGFGILDFDRGYDTARVNQVLGSYGADGMALYGRIQLLDLFNPALYSLVAAAFARLLWRGHGPDWLCLPPLLAGLGDYAENFTLYLLARSYPDISERLVSASSTLSLAKNGLMVVGMLPLVVGLLLLAVRQFRKV